MCWKTEPNEKSVMKICPNPKPISSVPQTSLYFMHQQKFASDKKKFKNNADEQQRSSFFHSLSFRLVILAWYSAQNAAYILMMSYTRTRDINEIYHPEVAAFMNELLKLFICLAIELLSARCNPLAVAQTLNNQLFRQPIDTLKIGLPAMLYAVQNVIAYYAAGHLSATAFMITQQLKLIAAAAFSIILLKRRLNAVHWVALFTLFAGVCTVQLTSVSEKRFTLVVGEQKPLLGFLLMATGCIISGYSGVFLEGIYKNGCDTSIWVRNIQMSLFMIPISFSLIWAKNYETIFVTGFLYGFDCMVWILICLLSAGSLAAGICIKFADNITKDMATSVAIILVTVSSVFLFNFTITWMFGVGTATVIGAIFLYSYASKLTDVAYVMVKAFNAMMNSSSKSDAGSRRMFVANIEQRIQERKTHKQNATSFSLKHENAINDTRKAQELLRTFFVKDNRCVA